MFMYFAIKSKLSLFAYRFIISHHKRSIITNQVLDYYGINTGKESSSPQMLNREEEYEELLITRLKETIIFSDDYPDKFVSFVNQNVASHNIENSLMNVQALSQEEILCFVKNALYILQLMDNNLFDVEISSTMQDKQVKKVNC